MTSMTERLVACPICAGGVFKTLPTPGHWAGTQVFGRYRAQFQVVRCRRCGFVFTNPRPAGPLLDEYYAGVTYEFSTAFWREKSAKNVLDHLATFCRPAESRLLDFGCGAGYFLETARQRGWKAPAGFEVGQLAIQTCQQKGLEVTGSVAWLKGQGGFEVITLNHVLEHVADTGGLFVLLRDLLRPGGHIYVEVPNVASLRARLSLPFCSRWLGFDERYRAFPSHLCYFTKSTLTRCLELHGFKPLSITTAGLGIEELFFRTDEGPRASNDFAQGTINKERSPVGVDGATGRGLSRRFKDLVKGTFKALGIGENLMAVAVRGG